MGVIGFLGSFLGSGLWGKGSSGGNVVARTAEVFRVNAEADAARGADLQSAALMQFAQEFRQTNRSGFDRLIDGVNRIPRPAMALGTIALFVSAMIDPLWFEARMIGIQAVPEPLWWLLGAVVSFYFGARFQAKGQQFKQNMTEVLAQAPQIANQIREIESLRRQQAPLEPTSTAQDASDAEDAKPILASAGGDTRDDTNPALAAWRTAG